MTWTDRQPLPNSPVTQRIVQLANNRFGAVISSLYGFWTAREAALRGAANAGQRRDAYSIISFDHNAAVRIMVLHLNLFVAYGSIGDTQ
jgi:hypothetical protein